MVLKIDKSVIGLLRIWLSILLLVPFCVSGQETVQSVSIDPVAKKLETQPVNLNVEEEDRMDAAFFAEGKAFFLRLSGTGRSAHTINTEDPVIFLLQNDSTVTLKSTAVQGFDDLDTGRSYKHVYSLQQQDLEMLSRSPVQAMRKYNVIGFDDFRFDEPAGANLQSTILGFLQNLDREGLLKKVVLTEPAFPGGPAVLLSFLNKNLRPLPALTAKERKTARIQFRVDEEGKMENVVIKQSAGAVYDAELLRIFSRMPRWKAGLADGSPILRDVALQLSFYLATDGIKLTIQ